MGGPASFFEQELALLVQPPGLLDLGALPSALGWCGRVVLQLTDLSVLG